MHYRGHMRARRTVRRRVPFSHQHASLHPSLGRWMRPYARDEPSPSICPQGVSYVPTAVRDQLLAWAHTTLASGHPGIKCTLQTLQGKYWWPEMVSDVRKYVSSCSICAQNKIPRHLPYGKLHPLPVQQRPWSHLYYYGIPEDIVSDRGLQLTSVWKSLVCLLV